MPVVKDTIHKVQIVVLDVLRHAETARFSTLMRPTGLESDVFKFHLRALVKEGYVEKTADGSYRLTADGKEFANNIDEEQRKLKRRPKLSVIVVVSRPGTGGRGQQFLFQQRKRNPYYGFWSFIVGPVAHGEPLEDAAARELAKQTGLQAACVVRGFYRHTHRSTNPGEPPEDILFAVMQATQVRGELSNTWHAGQNVWMNLDELAAQPHRHDGLDEVLAIAQGPQLTYVPAVVSRTNKR